MSLWQRIFGNPKSTLGGMGFGALLAAMGAMILKQAGCQFDQVQWLEVLALLWGGPTVTGALTGDPSAQKHE